MKIVILCATKRGYRVLDCLLKLLPNEEVTVFSFREEPWEPPFLQDIKDLTESRGAHFFETKNVGHAKWESFWESGDIELMLVVSWRYMIPSKVYQKPKQGTYVFHDSLLPAYRGFSPTVWAILNNEKQTGATLFRIAEEVDSGDIVDQVAVDIGRDDTIAAVMDKVTEAYLSLLEANLFTLLEGKARLIPQDQSKATFTCKRTPEDNRIHWQANTLDIYNLIRACTKPYPGAFAYLGTQKVKVWSSKLILDRTYVGRIPGRVAEIHPDQGVAIMTGDGVILLQSIQLEDGDIITADHVINSLTMTLE